MSNKRYKFGELNPAEHPQKGHQLDPGYYSGIDMLNISIKGSTQPRFLKKIVGPLKGIVLRVETPNDNSMDDTWASWIFDKEEEKPQLQKIKVRIPEFHAHLPEPEQYGPECPDAIAVLYPTFLAQTSDVPSASPGDIVWVDYLDRENMEDPIYIGRLTDKPLSGGTISTENNKPSSFLDNMKAKLGLSAPTGDSLSGERQDGQIPQQSERINENNGSCLESRDTTLLTPRCPEEEVSGLYMTTRSDGQGGFVELGKKQMTVWKNRNGSKKLVRADLERTLKLMEKDFIEQNGLKPEDVRQFINDGYRNIEKQACYYEKYKECLSEWKQNGSDESKKPYPVAKPGTSKHNNGIAVDFNQVNVNKKGSLLWTWLRTNSRKYGWVWVGGTFNSPEAWHYEFDEELARRNGLI